MFTMCICDLVKDFKVIGARIRKVPTDHETRVFCRRFWENLDSFLEISESDLGDKVSGLELAVEHFTNHREYLSDCDEVVELFNVVFMTCARVILSMNWQNLSDEDYAKESFIAALKRCEPKLVHYSHIQIEVLNQLVQAQWTEPLLAQIMDCGEEGIDKEEVAVAVSKYLFEQHPDILRLRLSLLMENGCDEFALNLATWLTKMLVFSQDIDVLQKYMILLIKQGQRDQFHKKCSKVQCHTAVEIIKCVREKAEYEEVALIMSQTFLGQDLFKPTYYCCTKSLLTMWMELQSRKDGDRQKFTDSLQKMTRLCKDSVQLTYFAEILHSLFDDEYLSICVSLLVKAFKADAVMFASHKRGVKDINLVSMTASLIHVCNLLSGMLRKHSSLISQLSMLTAFSLDPSQELYSFVELLYSVINAEKMEKLETKLTQETEACHGENETENESETRQNEAMNESSETIIEGETETITNEDLVQNDLDEIQTGAEVVETSTDREQTSDDAPKSPENHEEECVKESHAVIDPDPPVNEPDAINMISGTDNGCLNTLENGDESVEEVKISHLESSSEVAVDPSLTENLTQNCSENTENNENTENIENTANKKNTENSENTANTEKTENTENTENTEKTENTENTENIENTEDTKPVLKLNDSCENTDLDECNVSIKLHEEKKDNSISLPHNECKKNGEIEKTISRESGVDRMEDDNTEKSSIPDQLSEELNESATSKISSFSDSYEDFLRQKTVTPSLDSNADSPMSNVVVTTEQITTDTVVVESADVPTVLDGSDAPSSDHDRDDSRSNEVKDGQEEGATNMDVSDCSTEVNSIHDPESPDKVIMTRSLLRKRRSERPVSPGDKRAKYSDSEYSDSEMEAETEPEERNKYGIEIPGVDTAVLNELISTLEYLRDKELDPNLEWDTLKEVCEKRIWTRAQKLMTMDEEVESEVCVDVTAEDETAEVEMEEALPTSETVSVAELLERKEGAQLKQEIVSTSVVGVAPNPSDLPVLSSADIQEHLSSEDTAVVSAQARLDHITETLATRTGSVVNTPVTVPTEYRLLGQLAVKQVAPSVGSLLNVRPQVKTTNIKKEFPAISSVSPASSISPRTPAPRILGQHFRAVTPPIGQPAVCRPPAKVAASKPQQRVPSTVNELLSQRQLDVQSDVMAEGSPTYVIVKSPVNLDNQQCQLTKVNGQVYKIWQSKNKSKYNLTAGQRIIGIKPLFVKPGSEDFPSASINEQMDNQTIEQVLRSLMDKNKQPQTLPQTTVRELIANRDQKKIATGGSLLAVSLGEGISLPSDGQLVTASSTDASGTTTYIFNSVKLAGGQTVVTEVPSQIMASLPNNGQLLDSSPNVQILNSTDSRSEQMSPLARMGSYSGPSNLEVIATTAQYNQVNSYVVSTLNQHGGQMQPGHINKRSQQSGRTSVSSIHDEQVHRAQLSTAVVQQPAGVVLVSPGQTSPLRTNTTAWTSVGDPQLVDNIAQQERIRQQIQELLGMAAEPGTDKAASVSSQLSAVGQTSAHCVSVQSAGVVGQTRDVATIEEMTTQSTNVQGTVRTPAVQGTAVSSGVQMSVRPQGVQIVGRSPAVQVTVRSPGVQSHVRSPTVQVPLRSPGVQTTVLSPGVQSTVQPLVLQGTVKHAIIKRPYKVNNTRPIPDPNSTDDRYKSNLQHLAEAEKIRQQCLMQNSTAAKYQASKLAFQARQRKMQKVVIGTMPRDNQVASQQVARTQLLQNVSRPHTSVQQVQSQMSRTPTPMVNKAASNLAVTHAVNSLPVTEAVGILPVTQTGSSSLIQAVGTLAANQTTSNLTVTSLALGHTDSSQPHQGTVLLTPHSSTKNGPLAPSVLQQIKTLTSYNQSTQPKLLQGPPKPARAYTRKPKPTNTTGQMGSTQPAKPLSTESQNLKNQLIATWQSPPRNEDGKRKEREPVLASLAKRLNDTISQHQPGQAPIPIPATVLNSRTPKTVRTITSGRSPPANVPQATSAGYFVPTNVVKAYPGAKIQVLASGVVPQSSPPTPVNQSQALIVQRTQNQCNS